MFKFIFNTLRIKWAIYKANTLHNLTQRKYYVIKWQGKLRVLSTLQIKNMKKRRLLTKDLNWLKLQELAVYKTA